MYENLCNQALCFNDLVVTKDIYVVHITKKMNFPGVHGQACRWSIC